MEQNLLDKQIHDRSKKEMECALRKFYATCDRVENRRHIKSYNMNNFKISKAAYRAPNIPNIMDFLKFSTQDFNLCQTRHKQDIHLLKRWSEDCKLDQLGLSQQYLYTSYFAIASVLFEPEYSDARLVYAKNILLVTVIDNFFDCSASEEELHNIIELLERWDEYSIVGYHSEMVKCFFSAIHHTVEDVAAKAHIMQGRYVKDHLIDLWIELLKFMLVEFDWLKNKKTPSIEEYLFVGRITIGEKCIVHPTQYLLGPKLSKDVIESSEFNALCSYTRMVTRLLNDVQTYKREQVERSLNIVSMLMAESDITISEEEAIIQVKEMIETNRRQLLGTVLQSKGSPLPQVCKDLFSKTSKVAHILYSCSDEFRFPEELKNHINQVLHKPVLNQLP